MNVTNTNRPDKIHEGRNVKRFREMLGIKQDALALELGPDWSQKKVSLIEAKELIGTAVLAEIATALKIPVEAIKNFDEKKAICNIHNSYQQPAPENENFRLYPAENDYTLHPMDKLLETMEELRLLYAENRKLYERLLRSERQNHFNWSVGKHTSTMS